MSLGLTINQILCAGVSGTIRFEEMQNLEVFEWVQKCISDILQQQVDKNKLLWMCIPNPLFITVLEKIKRVQLE